MGPLIVPSHPASGPAARLRDTEFPPAGLWGAGLTWLPLSPALVEKGRAGVGSLLYFYREVSSQVCMADGK